MGLYFKFSIVFFYILMIAIYFIGKKALRPKRKFKLISFRRYFRYFKLYITKKVIILFIISSIISNLMVLCQNKKYQSLYQDNETLNIIGIIVSDKEELEYQDRYCVKVIYANQDTKYKGTKLYLKLSKKIKLEYGDKVEVTGKFIKPEVSRNYGGFSNKEYLKTLKIYGTVKADNVKVVDKNQANVIFMLANNVKIKLEENIDNLLDQEKASIFKGILLGDTSNIEDEIQESFRNSNISHILAVSGMHVAYIILGINLLFRTGLGKRQTRYLVILVLICYMFLTGFSPSIVRAVIMGIIVTLGEILHRKNEHGIGCALLVGRRIEHKFLQFKVLALCHKSLLLCRHLPYVVRLNQAPVAAIHEWLNAMAGIDAANGIHRVGLNHIHMAVVALGGIPGGSAIHHNERQPRVQAAQHRHHCGRGTRRGNCERQPRIQQRIEKCHRFATDTRITIQQRAIQVGYI